MGNVQMFRITRFFDVQGEKTMLLCKLERLWQDGKWTVEHAGTDDENMLHQMMGMTCADQSFITAGIETYQHPEYGNCTRKYYVRGATYVD